LCVFKITFIFGTPFTFSVSGGVPVGNVVINYHV
jgi:hypothetical protein